MWWNVVRFVMARSRCRSNIFDQFQLILTQKKIRKKSSLADLLLVEIFQYKSLKKGQKLKMSNQSPF